MRKEVMIPCAICTTLVGIGVAFLFGSMFENSKRNDAFKKGQESEYALEAEIASLQAISVDSNEMKETLHSATEVGNKVAELQNKYQAIGIYGDIEGLADELQTYFVSSELNGRQPWFVVYDTEYKFTWTFETTSAFSTDTLSALWLCHEDTTGDLVAYATADYDATTKKFSNVSYKMTSLGGTYVPAETEDGREILDDFIQQIQNEIGTDDVETLPSQLINDRDVLKGDD